MNILLVGQFKIRGDGWTEATRSLIKSIQTIPNVNLTLRNINMANNKPPVPEIEFLHLENNNNQFDVVLQKIIPNLFTYDASFNQNIGLCVFESVLPKSHPYVYKISSLLDKVTVTNKLEELWLSKISKIPVRAIGEAIDIEKYNKQYPPIHPIFQDKKIFKFLFAGENTERKNLNVLIKAYLTEFNFNESVALIIKTNNDVNQQIEQIKRSLRKSMQGHYPAIIIINGCLSDEQMCSLYTYSDCLVVPSKGESFCRGAAESLAAGKPVITTNNIGTVDFVNSDIGWLVNSTETQCYCENPPISELYTCTEKWQEISINDLMRCMREAAFNKELYNNKYKNIKLQNISQQFSYQYIGQRLLKAIEV